MARYHVIWASVEALQHDGSRESAMALAAVYPGRIARDLMRDDVVLALCCDAFEREELREVPAGSWLVRPSALSSRIQLVSDSLFEPYHKRIET